MARRLRLRSAGHPADTTMGSGRPAQRFDIAARTTGRGYAPGSSITDPSFLTNQRKLVREELVGRADHQRHGRVRELGAVTASARSTTRRRRPPRRHHLQHGRAPPATPPGRREGCVDKTKRSIRANASTRRPHAASQEIGRVDTSTRRRTAVAGRQTKAPEHLDTHRVRRQIGNRTRQGRSRLCNPTRLRGGPLGDGTLPSRALPRAHITGGTTSTANGIATASAPQGHQPERRHRRSTDGERSRGL